MTISVTTNSMSGSAASCSSASMPSLASNARYPFADKVRTIRARTTGSSSTTSTVCMIGSRQKVFHDTAQREFRLGVETARLLPHHALHTEQQKDSPRGRQGTGVKRQLMDTLERISSAARGDKAVCLR